MFTLGAYQRLVMVNGASWRQEQQGNARHLDRMMPSGVEVADDLVDKPAIAGKLVEVARVSWRTDQHVAENHGDDAAAEVAPAG